MKKFLAAIGLAAASLAPVAGAVTSASASTAAPARCVATFHFGVDSGIAGNIVEHITCGGTNHTFRARATCEHVGNTGSETTYGSYRSTNNVNSTAGCDRNHYILNGGYEYKGSTTYHVLWRYSGTPLTK